MVAMVRGLAAIMRRAWRSPMVKVSPSPAAPCLTSAAVYPAPMSDESAPIAGLQDGKRIGDRAQKQAGDQRAAARKAIIARPRDQSGRLLPTGSQTKRARSKRKLKAQRQTLTFRTPAARQVAIAGGSPGNLGADPSRTRRRLNLATMEALQDAFDRGGQKAIDAVMRDSPAIFLKMLVLLVPRELEVTTNRGVKGMSDEALEAAIEALERMLNSKVIEGVAEPGNAT